MRVTFFIYNFVAEKLPLQPWLTIRVVAEGLAKKGHDVHIVTDVIEPVEIDGVKSHAVDSIRGSNSEEVRSVLDKLRPDVLVFLPTPLNIVTTKWLDGINCRCVGFISYPFYNSKQLMTAVRMLGWHEAKQYVRHLIVPKPLWLCAIRRRMHLLITQSKTTACHLKDMLGNGVSAIYLPPGINLNDWPESVSVVTDNAKTTQLLYLGSSVPIRGFTLALDALAKVKDESIYLRVLARDADEKVIASINDAVVARKLKGRVEIIGGWLDRPSLVQEIYKADVVLQPFVLVPSELPVTAMEVIACGTPVIGSDIDGLPSTIGSAGTVFRQGDATALAKTIEQFASDLRLRSEWRRGCSIQRNKMQAWDDVIGLWEDALRG